MTGEKPLHHVSVEVPQVILYTDLKEKIEEIKIKRDSVMIAHSEINSQQDIYNKFIIILSLLAAFFESTKAQLNLADRDDWIAPCATLAPIFLSTILGIVSSLMKFKKFPERMEMLTKATEKSNATILHMRRLSESLNFQSYKHSYDEYNNIVTPSYRDALDHNERALYPHEHDVYLDKAIKIAANNLKREENQQNKMDEVIEKQKTRYTKNKDKKDNVNKKSTYVEKGIPLFRSESIINDIETSSTSSSESTTPKNLKENAKNFNSDIELGITDFGLKLGDNNYLTKEEESPNNKN